VFFTDPFAIRAPGFVVVREYDSSPPSHGSLGLGENHPVLGPKRFRA